MCRCPRLTLSDTVSLLPLFLLSLPLPLLLPPFLTSSSYLSNLLCQLSLLSHLDHSSSHFSQCPLLLQPLLLEPPVLGRATAAPGAAALYSHVYTCHSLSPVLGCLGRVGPSRVPAPANTPPTTQTLTLHKAHKGGTYAQPYAASFHTHSYSNVLPFQISGL